MNTRILLLEDDSALQSFLQTLLESQGYQTDILAHGQAGLHWLSQQHCDLLLLDLGLADMDGISLLQQLRSWSDLPVIVISARGKEQDKVRALDYGANDYVTKPFSSAELLARIRACLRVPRGQSQQFQFGDIVLNPVQHQVSKDGQAVHLTKTEYELLLMLCRHANQALTHNQILKQIWGETYQDRPEYVRVHMAQLRQKLEHQPATPQFIRTEPGVGYRLCIE